MSRKTSLAILQLVHASRRSTQLLSNPTDNPSPVRLWTCEATWGGSGGPGPCRCFASRRPGEPPEPSNQVSNNRQLSGGRQRTLTDDGSQVRHRPALAAPRATWLRDEEANAQGNNVSAIAAAPVRLRQALPNHALLDQGGAATRRRGHGTSAAAQPPKARAARAVPQARDSHQPARQPGTRTRCLLPPLLPDRFLPQQTDGRSMQSTALTCTPGRGRGRGGWSVLRGRRSVETDRRSVGGDVVGKRVVSPAPELVSVLADDAAVIVELEDVHDPHADLGSGRERAVRHVLLHVADQRQHRNAVATTKFPDANRRTGVAEWKCTDLKRSR